MDSSKRKAMRRPSYRNKTRQQCKISSGPGSTELQVQATNLAKLRQEQPRQSSSCGHRQEMRTLRPTATISLAVADGRRTKARPWRRLPVTLE